MHTKCMIYMIMEFITQTSLNSLPNSIQINWKLCETTGPQCASCQHRPLTTVVLTSTVTLHSRQKSCSLALLLQRLFNMIWKESSVFAVYPFSSNLGPAHVSPFSVLKNKRSFNQFELSCLTLSLQLYNTTDLFRASPFKMVLCGEAL